jgi:hypothetical protein
LEIFDAVDEGDELAYGRVLAMLDRDAEAGGSAFQSEVGAFSLLGKSWVFMLVAHRSGTLTKYRDDL